MEGTNMRADPPVLIVPGKGNSEATHWQSWLERRLQGVRAVQRVTQESWETPVIDAWASNVTEAISNAPAPPLLVAHSFGCLATVTALQREPLAVAGAILVAPADPARFALAESPLLRPLPCRALVVASTDDPWMRLERAEYFARAWGAPLHCLGAAGHINVASGFGSWPQILDWMAAWTPPARPASAAGVSISISDRNRSAKPAVKLA